MSVPHYSEMFTMLLQHFGDGREHRSSDTRDAVAQVFRLTEAEVATPSPGRQPQTLLTNHIAHAKARLVMAKLIEKTRPDVYRITEKGRRMLARGPHPITEAVLRQQPGYSFGR